MDTCSRALVSSFSGKFIQKITCKTCRNVSVRNDDFNSLNLIIPDSEGDTSGEGKLEDGKGEDANGQGNGDEGKTGGEGMDLERSKGSEEQGKGKEKEKAKREEGDRVYTLEELLDYSFRPESMDNVIFFPAYFFKLF
jgi:hypothetical protein